MVRKRGLEPRRPKALPPQSDLTHLRIVLRYNEYPTQVYGSPGLSAFPELYWGIPIYTGLYFRMERKWRLLGNCASPQSSGTTIVIQVKVCIGAPHFAIWIL